MSEPLLGTDVGRNTLVDGSPETVRRRVTLRFRAAMLVGAGLTIGVWLVAGIYFSRRIDQVQQRTAVVSQRYLRAQRLVTEARNQVLLSSVYLREALLDPSEPFVTDSRERMASALDIAERSLEEYEPVLDGSVESSRVERLRGEIGELRREMVAVLNSDRSLWPVQAGALLRGRLRPRRESVIRVADELGTVNRTAFVEHQAETAAIYRATQVQVFQVLGLAVIASLGIGLVAARYGGRLERRVQEQGERDVELQAHLQRLSAALIRAREDERQVVARELHDEIGQLLTASKVELAVAERAAGNDAASEQFEEARHVMDQALHAIRDLSHLLHPAMLDDLGLVAAVDWQVRAFRKRHDIDVSLSHELPAERLPSDVERAAYRIVQEALTNVARHAQTMTCSVSLNLRDHTLVVEIDDDGRGFDAQSMTKAGGLGLVSMRERASQLGGALVIESATGHGTRVTARLPVYEISADKPDGETS